MTTAGNYPMRRSTLIYYISTTTYIRCARIIEEVRYGSGIEASTYVKAAQIADMSRLNS